ncbi:hypothetical protein KR009_000305 [Drosophila setifemur]|nr:hypothetical protein KR009_000305 [Drosophila setifemur]
MTPQSRRLGSLLLGISVLLVLVAAGKPHHRADKCPTIKLKRQWGGKPATLLHYQVRPVRYVVIHHTVTGECSGLLQCAEILQGMQSWHQGELDYDDIGYNFLVDSDGVVYEGTGWGVRGAHTYGYNNNGTGIAFIGNYVEKLPTPAALKATKELLSCGVRLGELSEDYTLIGASQVISTQSPGLTLYNEIQEWPHWLSNP